MTRAQLSQYFHRIRETTENLCKPLQVEDQVVQPIMDVSPPKWHLGHTTWFFEAMFLDKYIPNYVHFHPEYAFVFNSYYESFGKRINRDLRGNLSRPSVEDTISYRNNINGRMQELIQDIDESKWQEFSNLVVLALNHEQQHQELLITDVKYILAGSPVKPAYLTSRDDSRVTSESSKEAQFIRFDGGLFSIGHQGDGFCYDNEIPRHKVYVNDFGIQNRLVTNGEFLEFIEDGGYSNFRFWLSDGWELIQTEGWNSPLYWEEKDGEWFEFTLSGLNKLDQQSPVCHVSYYEADAYAQWRQKRLPTEAEWEVASQISGSAESHGNFLDNMILHPTPAAFDPDGTKLQQMFGDVWEWTGSAYLAYPGYRRAEGPLGEYNGKFMINQMVLRGGSCATSRDHIRTTYRNFFQPEKRWQFKGFRLAE